MGLFSRSNKDKDKKDTDPNKVTIDLEKIKKDKNRDVTLPIYSTFFKGGANVQIIAEIHHLKSLFDDILSVPENKEALNYLKEKFGKDIDEKEIEKVLLLYVFELTLADVLEGAAKYLSSLGIIGSLGYYLYRDENILGGKLDEKTFRELTWEINKYAISKAYNEKQEQNKEQKDEQPK